MSHDARYPDPAKLPTEAPPAGQVEPELLSAYFDGELEAGEAARVEAAVRGDPRVREQLEDLRLMASVTRGVLEHEADAVPQARFEQVWDQIDRALDREAAERARQVGPWARFWASLRNPRWTLAGVGAAAAAVILVVAWPRGDVNPGAPGASVEGPAVAAAPTPQAASTPPPPTEPSQTMHATAPSTPPEPTPVANDAKVEVVEFGGKAGRIGRIEGRHGTTTVIWVTEEEPIDSERSL